MDIRTLRPGDEDLLIRSVAMIEEADLTEVQARDFLADPALVNVAALEADEIIGFAYGYVLKRFEAVSFFIYSVDVAGTHRRRGVGRGMIEAFKSLGAAGRWDEMFVLTNASNPAAMALYAGAGGVRPPPDDVVMFDFD